MIKQNKIFLMLENSEVYGKYSSIGWDQKSIIKILPVLSWYNKQNKQINKQKTK